MSTVEGIQVLLSTPFAADESLDYESAYRLADFVIEGGVDGIILLGSTGEFFALAEVERREFLSRMITHVNGRVPIGVCPGLPGTAITVALARHAEACGADYLLLPVPFYFANTVAGIVDFYTQVAHAVSIPVMPYDGGGGYELDCETWRDIVHRNTNVTLAKITTPFPPKIKWLHQEFNGRVRSFGGADTTILLSLANGAEGLTVAGANVVPQAFSRLFDLYRAGKKEEARTLYYQKIGPLSDIAVPAHTEFIQCYKQALYWMGVIASPHTRAPMMPLDAERQQELFGALQYMGVSLVRSDPGIASPRASGEPVWAR